MKTDKSMSAAKHTPNTTVLGLCEFWAKRIEDSTAGTWQRDDARAGMHGAIVAATKERGDLLAALEELAAECEEFHNGNTEGWNMARAAIAKATRGQS